jgi:TonB family protein
VARKKAARAPLLYCPENYANGPTAPGISVFVISARCSEGRTLVSFLRRFPGRKDTVRYPLGSGNRGTIAPLPGRAKTRTPRSSPLQGVQWRLIHKVNPNYPPDLRKAHIEGTVVLCATIGKDGKLHNLLALSGPQKLIPYAWEAVEQWRYEPYRVNKEPVDVDSEIRVDFKLGR